MSTSTQTIAPQAFECILDRDQAGMTEFFIPEAVQGVLIAGRDMLIAAGHVPGAPEPMDWTPGVPMVAGRSRRPTLKSLRLMANACFEPNSTAIFGWLKDPSE